MLHKNGGGGLIIITSSFNSIVVITNITSSFNSIIVAVQNVTLQSFRLEGKGGVRTEGNYEREGPCPHECNTTYGRPNDVPKNTPDKSEHKYPARINAVEEATDEDRLPGVVTLGSRHTEYFDLHTIAVESSVVHGRNKKFLPHNVGAFGGLEGGALRRILDSQFKMFLNNCSYILLRTFMGSDPVP